MKSLRKTAENCLFIYPEFSVVKDIYGYSIGKPKGWSLSLKLQLALICARGFNLRLFLVGQQDFTQAERDRIAFAVQFTRDTLSSWMIGIHRLEWVLLSKSKVAQFQVINTSEEAFELAEQFDDGIRTLDVFIVREIVFGDSIVTPGAGCSPSQKVVVDDPNYNVELSRINACILELKSGKDEMGSLMARAIGTALGASESSDPDNFMFPATHRSPTMTVVQRDEIKRHCHLNLEAWLALAVHTNVSDSIIWETPSGSIAWKDWSKERKKALIDAFFKCDEIPLIDPPMNRIADKLPPKNSAETVLSPGNAWDLYLATLVHSLKMELKNVLPWSLTQLSREELRILLDSRYMFAYDWWHQGYRIDVMVGAVVPAPPTEAFRFLREERILADSHWATIANLVQWSRRMFHYTSYDKDDNGKNMEIQWQYRGRPPVSRIIQGTTNSEDNKFGHYTAGCHGTVGFYRAVLRPVNIPVDVERVCGHALPHFPSIERYMSHGDDPYNRLLRDELFGAEEFLISEWTFRSWFRRGDACKNVGRRTDELVVKYPPLELLREYCNDMKAGKSKEDGEVQQHWRSDNTTAAERVTDLEKLGLWKRMDTKLKELGGCEKLPPP